jgi:hypothetical protein
MRSLGLISSDIFRILNMVLHDSIMLSYQRVSVEIYQEALLVNMIFNMSQI